MSARERGIRVAGRVRDALDHRLQHLVDAGSILGRGEHSGVGGKADDLLNLLAGQLRVGGREVDLVDHRDHLEVVLQSGIGVGQGLGLDPLAGVHHQQRPLAGGQRPGHLVGEVDVAGSVDQVQLIGAAVPGRVGHPHRLGLDGDAPLPLQVQAVEDLRLHVPGRDRAGALQEPVRQGRLAMVDVGDDREVADPGQPLPGGADGHGGQSYALPHAGGRAARGRGVALS